MQVQTYLFFEGRCEEALEFYQEALGAEIGMVMRFRENPDDPEQTMFPPGAGDKIMHAAMQIGETTVLASDGRCGGSPAFTGMSLTMVVPSEAEAERVYNAPWPGPGRSACRCGRTFFSPAFGMVTDQFGVGWMIYTSRVTARPTREACLQDVGRTR